MYYIKENNTKYILTNNGVDVADGNWLKLKIYAEGHTFGEVQKVFSSITEDIVIYTCIVQPDGRETDENISTVIPSFTVLKEIAFDAIENVYAIKLISPNDTDLRLIKLEKKTSEKPALTSPYTDNKEPTGIASRYYEVGELIAIYDDTETPITVMVVIPISYCNAISIGVNVKQYYGFV
ncbi:MAG: hypothetical protein J6U54_08835 [Clostridiales bacterium]|nr:hypothetical protein [Clostridiales bacterium]